MSLLTGSRTFDDMLAMADRGDNAGVDMLVGDIYGMDYTKIGLKSTAIASTFGKVFRLKNAAERGAEDGEGLIHDEEFERSNGGVNFRHEDMSRSLLYAIRYVLVIRVLQKYLLISQSATISAKLPTCSQKSIKSNIFTLEDRSYGATVRL
jgi:pantothenate kinase